MKIDLRTIPDAEVSGIDLMDVDITPRLRKQNRSASITFYGALKNSSSSRNARKKEQQKEFLTACITTFGCQMNARDSEKLEGILKPSATTLWRPRMLTLSFTIPVPSVKTPIFASTAVSDSLANTKRKIRA